jgi:hypothetical protein
MAADADPNGIGEWAWRIGSAIIGAGIMLVGFVKAWASTARDAKEARAGLPRIAALESWKSGADADHRALVSSIENMNEGQREMRLLLDQILQRLPRSR